MDDIPCTMEQEFFKTSLVVEYFRNAYYKKKSICLQTNEIFVNKQSILCLNK